MEPDKNPEQSNTPAPVNAQQTAAESLHDEGVDIVGTGVSEENEFSSRDAGAAAGASDLAPAESAAPAPQSSAATAPQPVPATPLKVPTAAEIIASLRQQKQATVPQAPAEKPTLSTESAKLIASLQEIPNGFKSAYRMPVPPPPVSTPVSAPVPAPTPMPRPTAAPQTYAPASSQPPATAPKDALQPEHPLNDPSIKHIRTFKSDAEEAVKYQNVSVVDIAIAEQKKREKTPIQYEQPATTHHAGIFIVVVMALMIVLGAGWYFWFSTSQTTTTAKAPATVAARTIIPYAKASSVVLDPESDSLILIGSKLAQGNAGLGNVYALIPVASSNSAVQADVASVFKDTSMPSRLARSLDQKYMIGTYTYDTQNPFLILKNTFFQNAFSGMLEWEKDMRRDLLPLSQIAHEGESAATAASSHFEDAIVSNIDARALKDADGKTVLIYAFADKDTIVVTTGESALKYILERLLTVRTIQ